MTRIEHAAVTRDRILRARLWLIPCALIWIPMGIGTMNGLAGKPRDAPHLLIPQDIRGWHSISVRLEENILRDELK